MKEVNTYLSNLTWYMNVGCASFVLCHHRNSIIKRWIFHVMLLFENMRY